MVLYPANSPIGRLLAGPMRPGRLEWIGVRPARDAADTVADVGEGKSQKAGITLDDPPAAPN